MNEAFPAPAQAAPPPAAVVEQATLAPAVAAQAVPAAMVEQATPVPAMIEQATLAPAVAEQVAPTAMVAPTAIASLADPLALRTGSFVVQEYDRRQAHNSWPTVA